MHVKQKKVKLIQCQEVKNEKKFPTDQFGLFDSSHV